MKGKKQKNKKNHKTKNKTKKDVKIQATKKTNQTKRHPTKSKSASGAHPHRGSTSRRARGKRPCPAGRAVGELEGRGLDVWPAGAPFSIQSSFQAPAPPAVGSEVEQAWPRGGATRAGHCACRGWGRGGAPTALGYAVPPVCVALCPSSCPGVQLQCKGLTWLQN